MTRLSEYLEVVGVSKMLEFCHIKYFFVQPRLFRRLSFHFFFFSSLYKFLTTRYASLATHS